MAALREGLASRLALSADDLAEHLSSSHEAVLSNRIDWALAYLQRTGLVEEAQNLWRLTVSGSDGAAAVGLAEFDTEPSPGLAEPTAGVAGGEPTPEAAIAASFQILHDRLKRDLLARIHAEPPQFFERLIIDLLFAMGYGGRRRDLVRHLGRSGDGGIDGAVHQDALGLDVVYVQAKRYRPGVIVPVSAVRDFAGSLDAHKAGKGVFVTTASFPKSAEDFVSAVPSKIVLIDGQALAGLLIRHDVCVRVRDAYEIKAIDESYFGA